MVADVSGCAFDVSGIVVEYVSKVVVRVSGIEVEDVAL